MLRLAAILTVCLFSIPAYAWWEKEHKIIAIIAETNLSQAAKKQVDILLDGQSLVSVATWADSIKSKPEWSHSKHWHYMNLASNKTIDKHRSLPAGDILWAINYFYQELQKPDNSKQDRREALMFFVHFVADIHQPLHVGKFNDAGGNRVAVNWYNSPRKSNLHRVWDGLLTYSKLTAKEYADTFDKPSKAQLFEWQNSTFADWANESLSLNEQIYDFGTDKGKKIMPLGRWYKEKNKPLANQRLNQAGIRLAFHLNKALSN
jgi:nitrate reductase assembly molybdenum cofactor insertion protein NarJ